MTRNISKEPYIRSLPPEDDKSLRPYINEEFRKIEASIDRLNGNLATNVEKEVGEQNATITNLSTTVGNAASDVTTLTSTVNGFSSSISSVISSVNGVTSKYGVKINNNGHVSGFGLLSTANNATPTSSFIVQADKFAVETATGSQAVIPFQVSGNNVLINNAHIENLTASKILLRSTLANDSGYLNLADLGVSTDKVANGATAFVADYFVGLQSISIGGGTTTLLNVSYQMPTVTSSTGRGKLSIILVPTIFGSLTGAGTFNMYFYVQGAPNWSGGSIWQSIAHNSSLSAGGMHPFMGSDSFNSGAVVNVQFYVTATGGWSGLQGGVNALLLGSWK